ncbi:hypothetical protein PV416_32325, partial [Streptomyces ipomoeae]|nr:hypothetical protein [Streptomyces ipomoeae]
MRPDDWHLTEDVDDFLARAGDFLRSRPGLHVMSLTWAERVRTRGAAAFGAEAPVFGVLERAGAGLAPVGARGGGGVRHALLRLLFVVALPLVL